MKFLNWSKKAAVIGSCLGLLSVVACSNEPKSSADEVSKDTVNKQAHPPVVVFSARKQHLIEPLFKQFTQDTGIEVDYITDNAQPLISRIKAQGDNAKADVFMATDAGSLWSAAEQGVLEPVKSSVLEQRVPKSLQDDQDRWFGLSKRARTIVYSKERVNPNELSTYAQ